MNATVFLQNIFRVGASFVVTGKVEEGVLKTGMKLWQKSRERVRYRDGPNAIKNSQGGGFHRLYPRRWPRRSEFFAKTPRFASNVNRIIAAHYRDKILEITDLRISSTSSLWR